MRLPERLARLASYVPRGAVVADIGTDHALLPIYLVREGISPFVIATDLHHLPLARARENVSRLGLEGAIELRQGDGLRALTPGEVEVVVIAGLGGRRVREVLEKAPEVLASVNLLLLQPFGGAGVLRRFLLRQGWALRDEELSLEEGRFYVTLVAVPDREKAEEQEEQFGPLLEFGPLLVTKKHPLVRAFLEAEIRRLERALAMLAAARAPEARGRRRELEEKLGVVREVFSWV